MYKQLTIDIYFFEVKFTLQLISLDNGDCFGLLNNCTVINLTYSIVWYFPKATKMWCGIIIPSLFYQYAFGFYNMHS